MALIFYKNLKKHPKTKEKNLMFSIFDEGVVSNKDDYVCQPCQCKNFYNLTYVDGALKTGIGFKPFAVMEDYEGPERHLVDLSDSVDKVCGMWLNRWYSDNLKRHTYSLFVIDSQNKLWGIPLVNEYNFFVVPQYDLPSYPTYQCFYRVNNKDASLFFTSSGMIAFLSGLNGKYQNVPPMISCAVHYDNFFGITNTNQNTLVYTKNKNLLEWDDSASKTIEFLDNVGTFNMVITFNDYVYLFREFGITKLSIYTANDDFSFTHLYRSPSKIYENTVCVCGDRIFFATRDGLYAFNGNSVSKIAEEYDVYFKNLENEKAAVACLNGKFYFATRCNFNDGIKVGCENGEYVNNALFELDIETFSLNLCRGVDVQKILPIDSPFMNELCVCFNSVYTQRLGYLDYSGTIFGDETEKSWTSFETDLNAKGKRKKIKEIVLTTHFPCTLTIVSDEETKMYSFDASDKEQRQKACIYGRNFQFIFSTQQQCYIQKPMIVYDVLS